jgi:hypothetical protein
MLKRSFINLAIRRFGFEVSALIAAINVLHFFGHFRHHVRPNAEAVTALASDVFPYIAAMIALCRSSTPAFPLITTRHGHLARATDNRQLGGECDYCAPSSVVPRRFGNPD